MALYKRDKLYHADFTVNGQRFRLALHTSDRREAARLEKEQIAKASSGVLGHSLKPFGRLTVSEALDQYLEDREVRVAARSHRSESDHAKPLKPILGDVPLQKISIERIQQYIRFRKDKGISNTTVNMEVGILRRILKRAKLWHQFGD